MPGSNFLVRVTIAVKNHHDYSNSLKEKYLIEVEAYSFRDFIAGNLAVYRKMCWRGAATC